MSRKNLDKFYQKKIISYLRDQTELLTKNNTKFVGAHYLGHLSYLQKRNNNISMWFNHWEIYRNCNIPRSSYNNILTKLIKKKIILKIPKYGPHTKKSSSYSIIALTLSQIKNIILNRVL